MGWGKRYTHNRLYSTNYEVENQDHLKFDDLMHQHMKLKLTGCELTMFFNKLSITIENRKPMLQNGV